MAGRGWSWVLGMKLWLVVGVEDEIMAGRGWSWVMAAKLWLVVSGRGWLWVVTRFSNALSKD